MTLVTLTPPCLGLGIAKMLFIITCISIISLSIYFKRADVAIALVGYLTFGLAIVISLFFACLYLYTDFVAGLWGC